MSAFQAIVLGIVQGLTEFLPISSTAHLRIIPAFLGWDDPGAAFTAVIQLGTMAAVVLHFWSDLWRIATTWLRSLRDKQLRGDLDARLGWYIGLGTIPIAVLGLLFKDPLPRLNAVKQVLALVINLVAAVFFSFSGHVLWTVAAVMAPASLLGGVLGGKFVGRIKPTALRAVVVTYGTVLAIWYLVR